MFSEYLLAGTFIRVVGYSAAVCAVRGYNYDESDVGLRGVVSSITVYQSTENGVRLPTLVNVSPEVYESLVAGKSPEQLARQFGVVYCCVLENGRRQSYNRDEFVVVGG